MAKGIFTMEKITFMPRRKNAEFKERWLPWLDVMGEACLGNFLFSSVCIVSSFLVMCFAAANVGVMVFMTVCCFVVYVCCSSFFRRFFIFIG